MQILKMKIVGYEEESNSLLVSYASDTTASQDPADYQPYAYQPINMWPDIDDVEEIKKRIALSGIYLAEQQARKESFVADQAKIAAYKALVGQTIEYQTADLIGSTDAPSPHEVVL